MTVERVQGISRLEQLCEELSEEERAKELKQEKKRQKRKNRRKNKCGFEQDAEEEKDKSLDEVKTRAAFPETFLTCSCSPLSNLFVLIFLTAHHHHHREVGQSRTQRVLHTLLFLITWF